MSNGSMLLIAGIIFIFGLFSQVVLIWFGYHLLGMRRISPAYPPDRHHLFDFVDRLAHMIVDLSHKYPVISDRLPQYASDAYSEYLLRRNEFWTIYGQVLTAILIVIILSILLVTKTITAEAGLPILSAVSGFAIAKGASVGKQHPLPHPLLARLTLHAEWFRSSC